MKVYKLANNKYNPSLSYISELGKDKKIILDGKEIKLGDYLSILRSSPIVEVDFFNQPVGSFFRLTKDKSSLNVITVI